MVVVDCTAYAGQPAGGAAWAAGITIGETARAPPASVAAAMRLAVLLSMSEPPKKVGRVCDMEFF